MSDKKDLGRPFVAFDSCRYNDLTDVCAIFSLFVTSCSRLYLHPFPHVVYTFTLPHVLVYSFTFYLMFLFISSPFTSCSCLSFTPYLVLFIPSLLISCCFFPTPYLKLLSFQVFQPHPLPRIFVSTPTSCDLVSTPTLYLVFLYLPPILISYFLFLLPPSYLTFVFLFLPHSLPRVPAFTHILPLNSRVLVTPHHAPYLVFFSLPTPLPRIPLSIPDPLSPYFYPHSIPPCILFSTIILLPVFFVFCHNRNHVTFLSQSFFPPLRIFIRDY